MKSKILFYLLILVFSTFLLTGCTSKENINTSKALVEDAQALLEEREYKKAVDKLSEALEIYPSNFDAYSSLMGILLEKGYFEDAENIANEASSRLSKEDNATIYTMIGSKYYEIGEFERAKDMFEKVKGDERANVGLAEVYIQKGNVDEAQKVLKGMSNEAKSPLLSVYLTLGNWSEGSEKIDNIDVDVLEEEVLIERISRLKEIYTLKDEDALYKNASLAGEYVNAGYPYLAIKILTDQGDEVEEYGDAQYFLGKAYLDYGEYEKAIEKLNNAILLDMNDVDVYANLARAYLLNKNIEKSLDAYKMAVANVKSDENEWAVSEYVDVLLENNMVSVATKLLVELIAEKDSFGLNIILADVYYKQNDLEKMGEILEKLSGQKNLKQAETQQLTKYQLLHALKDIEDVGEIESLLEKYVVFDRYNPEIPFFEAKLLLHQDENLKAKEALERAIELDLEGGIAEQANKLLATIN